MTDTTETIIALDPGGTTGWATWTSRRLLPETYGESPWVHFTCGQIGPDEHHEELYAWLESQRTHRTSVVCERFDFRLMDNVRHGTNLISREYIGVAKLFVVQSGQAMARPIIMQTPAQAKTFVTDEKLKAMGLYVRGQQHARDAMRHLLTYMITKKGRTDLIQVWKDL